MAEKFFSHLLLQNEDKGGGAVINYEKINGTAY